MDPMYQPIAVFPSSAEQKPFMGYGSATVANKASGANPVMSRQAFPSPPLPSPRGHFTPTPASTHPSHMLYHAPPVAGPASPMSPEAASSSASPVISRASSSGYPFPPLFNEGMTQQHMFASPVPDYMDASVAAAAAMNGSLPWNPAFDMLATIDANPILDNDLVRPIKRSRTRSVSSNFLTLDSASSGTASASASPIAQASTTMIGLDDLFAMGVAPPMPHDAGLFGGNMDFSTIMTPGYAPPSIAGFEAWNPASDEEMMALMASIASQNSLASPAPSMDTIVHPSPSTVPMMPQHQQQAMSSPSYHPFTAAVAPFNPAVMGGNPTFPNPCPPSPPQISTTPIHQQPQLQQPVVVVSSPQRRLKRKKSITSPASLPVPAPTPRPIATPMSPPKTVLAPTAAMVESAVLEAAQSPNGSAEDRPRAQRLRFEGDLYTPGWVRHGGHLKEGLCELCPAPGRWLQLKNSAFWYHKQFLHGISSVSGLPFTAPLDLRVVFIYVSTSPDAKPVDATTPPTPIITVMVEGLCHECKSWHALMNSKRRCTIPMTSLVSSITDDLPLDPFPASLERLDATPGTIKILAPRHPVTGSVLLPTQAAIDWAHSGDATMHHPHVQRHHHHLPTSAAQDVRTVVEAKGMTVMWFRHAHKCHVYDKPRAGKGMEEEEVMAFTSQAKRGRTKTTGRKSPVRSAAPFAYQTQMGQQVGQGFNGQW